MEHRIRRLAIYVTYNPEGIVEEYITYMITALKSVADDVFVVSNNYYLPNEKDKLATATKIYERNNEGFDVGAFSYVINQLVSTNEISVYDELILINDSIFGPFFDMAEIFYEMDSRDKAIDFWGITRRGKSNFDGGDSVYPEHLQSYFYVCKKRLLHSKDFIEYWKGITKKISGFRSAILNYEFAFTKHFEELGYNWDTYCNCDKFITDNLKNNLSPYHYGMYELVSEQHCPFLKRKLFTGDFVDKQYTDSLDLKRAVDYIDKYTDYDVGLMWKHIVRNYQMADIIKAMHLTEVIESKSSIMSNISLDIFNNSKYVVDDFVADRDSDLLLYISIPSNIEPNALRDAYFINVRENLFEDNYYLTEVIKMFKDDRFLGVVIPPLNTFGTISKSIEEKWISTEVVSQIIKKYNLTVPVSVLRAPIHEIKAFICRKEILTEEMLVDIKNDSTGTVMQMMPVIAQQAGFFTKIVVNKTYVPALMDNVFYFASSFWAMKKINVGNDMTFKEMEDETYRVKVNDFLNRVETAYIYGAGQLAYRVLNVLGESGKIIDVVVSDTNGNPEYVHGYKVKQINQVTDSKPNYIITVGKKNNDIVLKKLKEKGLQEYLIID